MIKTLKISNFLLIKEQTINFNDNITTIFGETGSGKSLIFKALTQIAGFKSDSKLIGPFKDFYNLEAHFAVNNEIEEFLKEKDIEILDELIITKKVSNKTTIRINGELVNQKTLKELSEYCFEFTFQNQYNKLADEKYLIDTLSYDINLENYSGLYKEYCVLKNEIRDLDELSLNKEENLEIFNYRIKQLKNLDFVDSFESYIDYLEEFDSMKNIENLKEENEEILQAVHTSYNVLSKIESVVSNRDELPVFKDILDNISSLEDLDFEINKQLHTEFDEYKFDEYQENINNFKMLTRKFKKTPQEIFNYKKELEQSISELESIDIDLQNKKKKFNNLSIELEKSAKEITTNRKKVAIKIEKDINVILKKLKMKDVDVKFEFSTCDFNKYGNDFIQFKIKNNNSQDFLEVNQIASGGELSRILLAFKVSSPSIKNQSVLFDEIDAGISGNVASLMAKFIKELSKTSQVIYISHSPQMIVVANQFLNVEKKMVEDIYISTIKSLNESELVEKLSYFIQNDGASNSAKKVIKDMIKEVKNENISN